MKSSIIRFSLILSLVLLTACESKPRRFVENYHPSYTQIELDKSIVRLDLSKQNLQALPKGMEELDNLHVLDLTANPALNWPKAFEQICQLPKLKTLILSNNDLTTLPQQIAQCHNLSAISLAANPRLDFAQALIQLQGLPINFINLADNQLTRLPEQISQFKQLRDLRLSHNLLNQDKALTALRGIRSLHYMWLDNNHLVSLPSSLTALNQLRYLYLDNNQLKTLPDEFTQMRLNAVWLGHNYFNEIPDNLARSSVIMAFLNNNQINQLGTMVENKRFNIRGIILDNNQLSEQQVQKAKSLFDDTFIFQADNQAP